LIRMVDPAGGAESRLKATESMFRGSPELRL
jgi:hypothetical protein